MRRAPWRPWQVFNRPLDSSRRSALNTVCLQLFGFVSEQLRLLMVVTLSLDELEINIPPFVVVSCWRHHYCRTSVAPVDVTADV